MGYRLLLIVGVCGLSAPDASADELSKKCEAALDAPTRISFEAETQVEWAQGDPQSQETHHELYRCVFRRDGKRFEADAQTWMLNSGYEISEAVENRAPDLSYHALWGDGRFARYQRPTHRPGGGITSADAGFATQHMMASLKDGKVLEGYLLGDLDLRWPTVFRKATHVEATPDTEKLSGVSCIRLRCRTEHGAYAVWIDPERDHRARRIEVVRSGDDLLSGKPLSEQKSDRSVGGVRGAIREHRLIVENVRFEKIAEHWLPVGVEIRDSIEYTNGVFFRTIERQTRKNVNLGPEAIPADAFLLLDVPEGTKFYDQDEKGVVFILQNRQFVRHVRQGAEFVPQP